MVFPVGALARFAAVGDAVAGSTVADGGFDVSGTCFADGADPTGVTLCFMGYPVGLLALFGAVPRVVAR